MRLIYAESGKMAFEHLEKHLNAGDDNFLKGYLAGAKALAEGLAGLDAVDAVPVVRCKDCVKYTNFDSFRCKRLKVHWCKKFENITLEDDFCSYGERRSNETD